MSTAFIYDLFSLHSFIVIIWFIISKHLQFWDSKVSELGLHITLRLYVYSVVSFLRLGGLLPSFVSLYR